MDNEIEQEPRARTSLRDRQSNYQTVFLNPKGEKVLADLAKFCRAHESTFHPDPRVQAALEGRREVWLRIQEHLKLDPDKLWAIYSGGRT